MEIYRTPKFNSGGPAMLSSGRVYAVKLGDGRFSLLEPWCDAIGWEPRYGIDWLGIVDVLPSESEPYGTEFKDSTYNQMVRSALESRGLIAAGEQK